MKKTFPLGLKIYLALVIVGGIIALYLSFPYWPVASPINYLIFALIIYLAYILSVQLPKFKVYLSVASHLNFAALFLFGPFAIWIPALTGALPDSLPFKKPYVYLFNGAQLALSYGLATIAYFAAGGTALSLSFVLPVKIILPAFLAGLVYSLVNVSLTAGVVSFDEGNFPKLFREFLRWEFPNILIAIPFGLFLAYLFLQLGFWGLLILFLPLLASRYIFQSYIRIEEIFSGTLSALMAIVDRKFGERERNERVYHYAKEVSKYLGLSEEEADLIGYASYLRHIGLLGLGRNSLQGLMADPFKADGSMISEALLAGSRVLESTERLRKASPYIRYHHERWDGSGPWRLKGENIPLGARIVAAAEFVSEVEDSGGSKEAALKGMEVREGKDFDPKVVEALKKALREDEKQRVQ